MTEREQPVMASGRDEVSRSGPEPGDEIAILDYVLLDFADGSYTPRENARWEIVETEPWSHDG